MNNIEILKKDTIERNRESLERWRTREVPKIFEFEDIKISAMRNVFPPKVDSLLLVKAPKLRKSARCLDICAGTGIQAVYLAKKRNAKKVISCDISEYAIENIKFNIKENNCEEIVEVVKCDVFPDTNLKFDYIFANPPYLDYEANDILEQSVWDKGNKVLIRILAESDNYLERNGKLFISWANSADYDFLEKEIAKYGWKYRIIAKGGNDPIFNATIDPRMESRIYELFK